MKSVIYPVLVMALPFLCLAGYDESAFAQLIRNGALAKYVYRVVDDEGLPVSNATAHIWFKSYGRPQDEAGWVAETDTNGIFVAEHRLNEKFSVGIDKEGYYHTHDEINYFGMSAEKRLSIVKDGKWQPYGETRTVVLKKIKNLGGLTVPPCLVRVEASVPVYGEWLPFDLEKFDWVAPYGLGNHDDVLLRFRRRVTAKWNDFTYEMDVSFTNNPFAGVVKMVKNCGSDFTTVYNANPDADFIPSLNYYLERTEKGGSKANVLEKDFYLIFRTRTSVDDEGKLKTAHYGTIHGEWMPGKTYMSFMDGCFNPNPNDTNIEDGYQLREAVKHYKDFKAGGK